MNPTPTTRVCVAALLLSLVSLAAGCGTSAATFVDNTSRQGFSVISGELLEIENLGSDKIRRLNDGRAIWLVQPNCRLTMRFDAKKREVIEPHEGSILVQGSSGDYVLEPRSDATKIPE